MKFRPQLAVLVLLSLLMSMVSIPRAVAYPVSSQIAVWIDGVAIRPSSQSMQPYINQDGRTMISVRSIAESLTTRGCSVDWDGNALKVTLGCNDKQIHLFFERRADGTILGTTIGWVNGVGFHLHTAPEISYDRAFLGLRDIGELLDIRVEYIPADVEHGYPIPVATLWFDQLDLVDREEYAAAVEYLARYTFALANEDGTVTYGVEMPNNEVTLPISIRPQHLQQYIRSVAEANDMQQAYTRYAQAPSERPMLPAAQSILTAPEYATASTLTAQRQVIARKLIMQNGMGTWVVAASLPAAIRRFRDQEGTLIEVYPSGEKHYLTRTKAHDLASKFKFRNDWGGVGTFLATIMRNAWPVGSLATAFVLLSVAAYSSWMSTRLYSYCLADNSPGAIVQYYYVRVPQSIAVLLDRAIRNMLGISSNVGRILYAMPYDCAPWSGNEP